MDLLLAEMELASIDSDGNGQCSLAEVTRWWEETGRGAPPQRCAIDTALARAGEGGMTAWSNIGEVGKGKGTPPRGAGRCEWLLGCGRV